MAALVAQKTKFGVGMSPCGVTILPIRAFDALSVPSSIVFEIEKEKLGKLMPLGKFAAATLASISLVALEGEEAEEEMEDDNADEGKADEGKTVKPLHLRPSDPVRKNDEVGKRESDIAATTEIARTRERIGRWRGQTRGYAKEEAL